jgi:hypothetical protein
MQTLHINSGELARAMTRSQTLPEFRPVMNNAWDREIGPENPAAVTAPEGGYDPIVPPLASRNNNASPLPRVPMNRYDSELGNNVDTFA